MLVTSLSESAATSQAQNVAADTQRLHAWTQALKSTTATQQNEWKLVGEQTLANQQAILHALESTSVEISKRTSHEASQAMMGVSTLLERSEALISSRIDTEAQWNRQQGERMDQISSLWRKELGALRDDETLRGQAAVERLGQLQEALSRQLATLGTALEEPLSRLMATASEAPRAAAELIGQLRREMTLLSERDNLALEERTSLMGRLGAILEVTDKTACEQRAAIESLVSSAATVLDKAGNEFVQMIDGQLEKAGDVSTHVSASAIELSSLGESFHLAVKLFTEANDKMIASLQRVEGAVSQSMQRSDEQLAYYVGQAREVIDLSLSSQRAVVEDLRSLHSKQLEKAEAA
jgi:hypothetical protein